jgi:subfamily B ATP-binding cassette protein HlyB/CyaB
LVLLLRFHGIAATADQIHHRFGQSGRALEALEMVRCAKAMGLKASLVTSSVERLRKPPLPALAALRNGETGATNMRQPLTPEQCG